MVWFAIVLAGGMTSFYLGSYSVGYVMTQLAWQNHRGDDFGNIKAAIWLLTRNDLAAYHQFSLAQLRDGIVHLGAQDDDWRCSDNQGRTLAHARNWLKNHPDREPASALIQPIVERGLHACDKP